MAAGGAVKARRDKRLTKDARRVAGRWLEAGETNGMRTPVNGCAERVRDENAEIVPTLS